MGRSIMAKKGEIINRNGEINYNTNNEKMTIIQYNKNNDILISFDNGYKVRTTYQCFMKGNIKNEIKRIGEINYNKYGSKMTIVEYNSYNNITVEFDNGYKTKSGYGVFKKGNIKSPYDKSVCNIGYIGEGKYKINNTNGKHSNEYSKWAYMFTRCYNENERENNPTYKNAIICDEWHCYQSFAKWYEENYYQVENELMVLDKDILYKGNKVYSPETCIFVPERINVLFVKNDARRGDYPIGVSWYKESSKYMSNYSKIEGGKKVQKYLGLYTSSKKAFEVYKQNKEKYIKEVAEEYKNNIPKKLYDALYKYEVEIDD